MSIFAALPPPIHLKSNLPHPPLLPSKDLPRKLRPQNPIVSSTESLHSQAQNSPESSGSDSTNPEPPAYEASASTPAGSIELPDNTNQITRDWSVPSRPKPGRKPAINTPPTKRKAQNRAAQRAFRQRRAAEVGDLQEQLNLKQEEFDRKEAQWEIEKQRYQHNVEQWRKSVAYWQQATDREHGRVKDLEAQVKDLQNQLQNDHRHHSHGGNVSNLANQVSDPLSSWHHHRSTPITRPAHANSSDMSHATYNNQATSQSSLLQDMGEPSANNHHDETYDDMEVDFTEAFAKPIPQNVGNTTPDFNKAILQDYGTPSMVLPSPIDDGCGFCDPGGLCVCKEMAAESTMETERNVTLPSMTSNAKPVNTTSDARGQVMEPRVLASGPGTCPACVADPERQSFCRSLAGLMPPPPLPRTNSSSSSSSSSMDTNTTDGTKSRRTKCAKNKLPTNPISTTTSTTTTTTNNPPRKLTCSDTFDKLSQIPNFRDHKDEFLHRLTAESAMRRDAGYDASGTSAGGAPLAVDAASFDAALLLTGLKNPMHFHDGLERGGEGIEKRPWKTWVGRKV